MPPVAVAAEETSAAREALDQLIRELRPIIGDDRAYALDRAANELEGSARSELTARVVAALFHDSTEANTVILFQRSLVDEEGAP